ncbi:MAG: serine/threonine-protein kinase [Simkaniaceae bacterium]|nr:serine/threonine-protein kinase [Simkaniaceae bacterium]
MSTPITHLYIKFGELGRGSSATVYDALDIIKSKKVAIKEFSNANKSYYDRELGFLSRLNYPCIISYLDEYKDPLNGNYCLVLPKYERNVFQYIQEHSQFSQKSILANTLRYAQNIFDGLSYLEKNQTIHLDIKPENLLISDKNLIVIADFGLSRFSHQRYDLETLVTLAYRSPENLFYHTPSFSNDMWSAGATIYEIHTGKLLFKPKDQQDLLSLMRSIRGPLPFQYLVDNSLYYQSVNEPNAKKTKPSLPPLLPDSAPLNLREILEGSLCLHPEERIKTEEAILLLKN